MELESEQQRNEIRNVLLYHIHVIGSFVYTIIIMAQKTQHMRRTVHSAHTRPNALLI